MFILKSKSELSDFTFFFSSKYFSRKAATTRWAQTSQKNLCFVSHRYDDQSEVNELRIVRDARIEFVASKLIEFVSAANEKKTNGILGEDLEVVGIDLGGYIAALFCQYANIAFNVKVTFLLGTF